MEKPIIVKLGTGFANDLVTYIENGEEQERIGLCKRIDNDFLQQPFRDVVSYLCNPREDEYNQRYSQSETELAERIEGILAQNDVVLNARKSNGYEVNNISLETLLGDKYGEIVQVEEIRHEGQIIPVSSLDLTIINELKGGNYRS